MNFLLSKSNILIFLLQIVLGFNLNFAGSSAISTSNIEMQNAEKEAFNQTFLMYQGQQSGSIIKQLIATIDLSNSQSEHKVEQQLDGNADFTVDDIIVTQKYNVYLHYNSENGFIDSVVINTIN